MAEPINLELLARHLQGIRAELRDMRFHAENDRRNVRSQFDNLAATHASQLGDVEAKMAARLDEISKRFWASALPIWTKNRNVEANVVARLDGIEALGERFAPWTKFGRLEDRMEHLIALASNR